MQIAHYTHRLPADYDVDIIRRRAGERGPLWDQAPELYFKAFMLRAAGEHGAIAHSYSSLYLWRQDSALAAFLLDGSYKTVTNSFGRAAIHTNLALDARRGSGREGRFASMEEVNIGLDSDIQALLREEVERNRQRASQAGVLAAAVGVDTANWTLLRLSISETPADSGVVYDVLHLARPLLETLAAA